MAEFCAQCAAEIFGNPALTDLAGITTQQQWDAGMAMQVICEGCGATQVDPQGNCIWHDTHCKREIDDKRALHAAPAIQPATSGMSAVRDPACAGAVVSGTVAATGTEAAGDQVAVDPRSARSSGLNNPDGE